MAQPGHGLGTLRLPDDPWGRLPSLAAAAVLLTSASLLGFLRLIEEPSTAATPLSPPVSVEVMEVVAARPTTANPVTPKEARPLPASPRRAEPPRPMQDSPRPAPARQPPPEVPPAAPLPLT